MFSCLGKGRFEGLLASEVFYRAVNLFFLLHLATRVWAWHLQAAIILLTSDMIYQAVNHLTLKTLV